jgi:hypothetical protein
MQQSCVDEHDAWELEQSWGLGSREILVVRVVEAVLFFEAPGPDGALELCTQHQPRGRA